MLIEMSAENVISFQKLWILSLMSQHLLAKDIIKWNVCVCLCGSKPSFPSHLTMGEIYFPFPFPCVFV